MTDPDQRQQIERLVKEAEADRKHLRKTLADMEQVLEEKRHRPAAAPQPAAELGQRAAQERAAGPEQKTDAAAAAPAAPAGTEHTRAHSKTETSTSTAGGLPVHRQVRLDNGERRMTGEELVQERMLLQASNDLMALIDTWTDPEAREILDVTAPSVQQWFDALTAHAGGDLTNLKGASEPRTPSRKKWQYDPWSGERNAPIGAGGIPVDPKTTVGMQGIQYTLMKTKHRIDDFANSGRLPRGLDPDDRPAAGNVVADGLGLSTWFSAQKHWVERGAFGESARQRRLAWIVAAMSKREAGRMGEFHLVMNTEHAIEKCLAGSNMKSLLRAVDRQDHIDPANVSKSLQRNMFFTGQVHSARIGAGYLAAIEDGTMPAPAVLFPQHVLDVTQLKTVVDAMLGGAENSAAEDQVGKMQHFWGRQMHQLFAARKEIQDSIRHGDGEAVDMLIHYLLPMMRKTNKSGYVIAFMRHIIQRTFDAPMRRWRWNQRRYANYETVGSRKNAMDAMIEFLMGELKPICRQHGLAVMMEFARNAYFATELRRMMTKRQSSERGARPRYVARRYKAQAQLMRLFMRFGVATIANLNASWKLEARTLHRIAHEEGAHGGAISFEGFETTMSVTQLAAFGVHGKPAGDYRVFRAEAGPDNKITLRLARVR